MTCPALFLQAVVGDGDTMGIAAQVIEDSILADVTTNDDCSPLNVDFMTWAGKHGMMYYYSEDDRDDFAIADSYFFKLNGSLFDIHVINVIDPHYLKYKPTSKYSTITGYMNKMQDITLMKMLYDGERLMVKHPKHMFVRKTRANLKVYENNLSMICEEDAHLTIIRESLENITKCENYGIIIKQQFELSDELHDKINDI